MAHDIARINGRESFAYHGEKPWHQLGTEVPGLMTVREALVAGNLDWDVVKLPLMLDDLSMMRVPGHYATCRIGPEKTDDGELIKTPLGVVGEQYTVVNNRDAFAFFDSALGEGAAVIETVGALGLGERVFAMVRVPGEMEITEGDPIEPFILLHTSHDGSSNVEALFTQTRVVCNNTLQCAIKGACNRVKIRHTKSVKAGLAEAHRVLCANEAYWAKTQEAYKAMALRDMTRLDVMSFFDRVFPGKKVKDENGRETIKVSTRTENNRQSVLRLFDGEMDGADDVPAGSAWALYQAATQYVDHERSIKKDSNRWESSTFGSGATLRQRAFNALTDIL